MTMAQQPTLPPSQPPRRQRGRTLRTLEHVRSGLAATINALWAGVPPDVPLDPKRANALVYAYSVLTGLINGTAIEERIARIERAIGEDPTESRRVA